MSNLEADFKIKYYVCALPVRVEEGDKCPFLVKTVTMQRQYNARYLQRMQAGLHYVYINLYQYLQKWTNPYNTIKT